MDFSSNENLVDREDALIIFDREIHLGVIYILHFISKKHQLSHFVIDHMTASFRQDLSYITLTDSFDQFFLSQNDSQIHFVTELLILITNVF